MVSVGISLNSTGKSMKLSVACWLFLVFWIAMSFVDGKSHRGCQRQRRRGKCHSTMLLTRTYGSLQSPGYPRGYSNNDRGNWHIRVPKGYRIRLRFRRDFHVEDSPMCQKDALIVSFDKNFKDTKLLCGKQRPRGITSPRNELWLKFRVDDDGVGKGFSANYRAIDVNECRKEVCKFPSLCRNTVGSYMCDCPDGYKLRGRKNSGKCVDIDECKAGFGKCDFRCVNTAGSYHCTCPRGYRLAYNERSCRDINECSKRNGGCSHQCLNTRGSYSCACPAGYKLDATGKTCQKEIFFDNHQKISYVNEDAAVGTVIAKIGAKPLKKLGQKIVYSIIAENLKATTKNPTFKMDKQTGEIKLNTPLDREKTSEYLLEVEAKYVNANDSKKVTNARSFVAVRILDVNDNAPRFSYPAYTMIVPCDVKPGSFLYTLVTYDADEGKNARVTYRLEPANPYFTVQKHSGKVKVKRSLRTFCNESIAGMKKFEYKVVATDRGSPALRTRVKLRFIIAAIDLPSQTMFVWYSKGSDFKVVHTRKSKTPHRRRQVSKGKRRKAGKR